LAFCSCLANYSQPFLAVYCGVICQGEGSVFRVILGVIIYIFSIVFADRFIVNEVTSIFAHGISLLLAVFIPCVIKKNYLNVGTYSFKSILFVLISFCLYKLIQVIFFLDSSPQNLTGNTYTYYFIALGIVSIAEELFFRGILFDELKFNINQYVATVVSVLAFTLIHFSNSFEALMFNFISGVIFVSLRIKYKGVLVPVLAHLTGNWTVFVYLNSI
jgi:membrane protease YdiL (CAAX protease family)